MFGHVTHKSRRAARLLLTPMADANCCHFIVAGSRALLLLVALFAAARSADAEPIDRHSLVSRHDPVVERFDPESPFSVGNGEFAFTADVTGLQTFPEAYETTIPLGTLSHWGWHSAPNPNGWSIDKYHFTEFDAHGRMVGYADIPGDRRTPEIEWLRANPHRLHLGRVGFRLTKSNGEPATPADLTDIRQTLRLWDGVLVSHFRFDGRTGRRRNRLPSDARFAGG